VRNGYAVAPAHKTSSLDQNHICDWDRFFCDGGLGRSWAQTGRLAITGERQQSKNENNA
jgi:hypothetical protein